MKVFIVYKTSFTFLADLLQDLKEKPLEVSRRGMDQSGLAGRQSSCRHSLLQLHETHIEDVTSVT